MLILINCQHFLLDKPFATPFWRLNAVDLKIGYLFYHIPMNYSMPQVCQ